MEKKIIPGVGGDRYVLVDTDNGDVRIYPKEAAEHVVPFEI